MQYSGGGVFSQEDSRSLREHQRCLLLTTALKQQRAAYTAWGLGRSLPCITEYPWGREKCWMEGLRKLSDFFLSAGASPCQDGARASGSPASVPSDLPRDWHSRGKTKAANSNNNGHTPVHITPCTSPLKAKLKYSASQCGTYEHVDEDCDS